MAPNLKMWKRGWLFWLGLLLGPVFIFIFIRGARLSEMGRVIAQAEYLWVVPAIIAYFAGLWLRAVRWRFFLSPLGDFPPHRLFSPIIIGFAINNILPGKLGLVARAYLVGEREKINKMASGSTIVVDQLFDGVALVFFMGVIALFVPLAAWARTIGLGVSVIYFATLLFFWLMVSFPQGFHRLAQPFRGWAPPTWRQKLSIWFDLWVWGLKTLRHPGKILLAFLLSLLVWLFEAGTFYFVAQAFDLRLPFYALLLAVAIANMALAIPSLPGGIGPYDYFGKQALLLFPVSQSMATIYMGAVHLVLLLPVTVVGLALLWWQRRPLTAVITRKKEGGIPPS